MTKIRDKRDDFMANFSEIKRITRECYSYILRNEKL